MKNIFKKFNVGKEIIKSLKEAVAYEKGEVKCKTDTFTELENKNFTILCQKCGSDWTRIYTELKTEYPDDDDSLDLIFQQYHTYIECKNCGNIECIDFLEW